jgi:hypothetical protein
MATIIINDKVMTNVPDGTNIRINCGQVYSNGISVCSYSNDCPKIIIKGNCGSIDCGGSVDVEGNVNGDIDCGGSCTCRDVSGGIDAGGSVRSSKVGGSIDAGGSVSIR